jgi:tungstate transport system permease protein
MGEFGQAADLASKLILTGDPDLAEIVVLSLRVSSTAVMLGCAIGLPLGAALAIMRFFGRGAIIAVVNALMGLPPVVVGLTVYMCVSRAGPFGWLDLLYTPLAMIIAQMILVTPLVTALSRQVIEDLNTEYDEQLRSLGVAGLGRLMTLLREGRHTLLTIVLAAFGRAIAEVGAVIIVGGNINHVTRVMTTAIALETSRGDLSLALALGVILLFLAVAVNAAMLVFRRYGLGPAYV